MSKKKIPNRNKMILVDEDEHLRVYTFQYGNVSLFLWNLIFRRTYSLQNKIISDLSRTENILAI